MDVVHDSCNASTSNENRKEALFLKILNKRVRRVIPQGILHMKQWDAGVRS